MMKASLNGVIRRSGCVTSLSRRRFLSSATSRVSCFSTVALDDVQVEHVRDEWKEYRGLQHYDPGKFHIQCLHGVATHSLGLPTDKYQVLSSKNPNDAANEFENIHAILVEGGALEEAQIPHTVRAIARCGAGTSNLPMQRLTQLGIPVFNTPGANKNAVAELILCSLLMGSRRIIDGINHMKDLGSQGLARERVEQDKAAFGGREICGKTLAVIGLGHIGTATTQGAAALGMNVVGYDPGISVENALSLPQDMIIAESLSAAVADADYVSLVIPYVDGTRGIFNSELLQYCKSNTVFINFGPSELIDSEAMKKFLDQGNGARYITDFPDDILWDHPECIILPHLGASTVEAGEAAANMAANTIRDFLETGTTIHAVNFPNVSLAERQEHSVRFAVVHKNVPGALASITEAVAKAQLNIVQQINQSKGDIGYTVMDIDGSANGEGMFFDQLQEEITMAPSCLSSRILYGKPGTGYARNLPEGAYFV